VRFLKKIKNHTHRVLIYLLCTHTKGTLFYHVFKNILKKFYPYKTTVKKAYLRENLFFEFVQ